MWKFIAGVVVGVCLTCAVLLFPNRSQHAISQGAAGVSSVVNQAPSGFARGVGEATSAAHKADTVPPGK